MKQYTRLQVLALLGDISDELMARGDFELAEQADRVIAAEDGIEPNLPTGDSLPADLPTAPAGDIPPAAPTEMPPADVLPPPEADLPQQDVPLGQQIGQLADKIDTISSSALDPIVVALKEAALLFAQLQPKVAAANLTQDQQDLFMKALELHEKAVHSVTNMKEMFDFEQLTALRQLAAAIGQ